MTLELVQAVRPKRVDPGIVPDVRPRATVAPQFNVVEMGFLAHTEDADQLVLAAVKRTLAGIRFHPHREVEHVAVDHAAGFDQLADMAPVHADVMNGTITRDRCSFCQGGFEERRCWQLPPFLPSASARTFPPPGRIRTLRRQFSL